MFISHVNNTVSIPVVGVISQETYELTSIKVFVMKANLLSGRRMEIVLEIVSTSSYLVIFQLCYSQ